MISFELCDHVRISNALALIGCSEPFLNDDLLRLEGNYDREEILTSIQGRTCALEEEGVSLWLAASGKHLSNLVDVAPGPVYDGRTQTAFDADALVDQVGIREIDAGDQHLREALDMGLLGHTPVHVEQVIDNLRGSVRRLGDGNRASTLHGFRPIGPINPRMK